MANRQPIQENSQRRREELEREVPNVPPRAANRPGPSRSRPANALRTGSRALSDGLRARRRQRNSDSEALVEENDEVGGNRNSHVEVPNDDTHANDRPGNDGTVSDGLVNDLPGPINKPNKLVRWLGPGTLVAIVVSTLITIALFVYLRYKIPTECQPAPELPSPTLTVPVPIFITVTELSSYVPESTWSTTSIEPTSDVPNWC